MNSLDAYFLALPPEHQATMLHVRDLLRGKPYGLDERYRWSTPVYYRDDRYVCYLYHERRRRRSYLAFVNAAGFRHLLLRAEGRKMMRFLVLEPGGEVPEGAIQGVLAQALRDA